MKVLIVDNNTKNLEKLEDLFVGFDFSVITKDAFSHEKAELFDLIIFSGGSGVHSVKNHPEDYKDEIEFIKKTDKKVIGICLGSEIIATAFNCSLRELKSSEKGITTIKMSKAGFDIVDNNSREISVYESHRFVIDKVSENIEVLATSDNGVEIFKHKNKPIYGIQFHPEVFMDKTEGNEIFMKILTSINLSKPAFDTTL